MGAQIFLVKTNLLTNDYVTLSSQMETQKIRFLTCDTKKIIDGSKDQTWQQNYETFRWKYKVVGQLEAEKTYLKRYKTQKPQKKFLKM